MAKMMRCTVPHWQGDTLVVAGVVVDPSSGTVVFSPTGNVAGVTVSLIADYFEPFESESDSVRKPRKTAARRSSK